MFNALRILFVNELLTMLRQPANLFYIFVFPMFFLWIMLFAFGSQGTVGPVTVEVVDLDKSALSADYLGRVHKLFESGNVVTGQVLEGDPAGELVDGRIRLTVPKDFESTVVSGGEVHVKLEYNASNSMATQIATRVFDPLTLHFGVDATQQPVPVHIDFRNASRSAPLAFSQYLVTGILVLSMMSTGVMSTMIVIAIRREQNTFKLMACMPLGAGSVLLGIVAARALVTMLAALLLLFVSVYGFGLPVPLDGMRLANAMALLAMGGVMLLALGLLASARIATAQGAIFLGNLVYIALLFLSDLAVPLRSLSSGPLHILSYLPTAEFVTALRAVLVQGKSLAEQWVPMLAMLGWSILFVLGARFTFRWHRA